MKVTTYLIIFNITSRSRSFSKGQIQSYIQLLKQEKDVSGRAASPCPIMSERLEFVSHTFDQDTTLYHGSSTFGHKNLASTSQLAIRKPSDLHFAQLTIVRQFLYVLRTLFRCADKDSPPSCAGKGRLRPSDDKVDQFTVKRQNYFHIRKNWCSWIHLIEFLEIARIWLLHEYGTNSRFQSCPCILLKIHR